jgi:aspartate racemase
MKIPGMIGGLAPESTIEYYRLFIATYRRQVLDGSYPPLIINSVDLKRALDLITAGRLPELSDFLTAELHRLSRAGADFALLASNTPHIVFDDLQRQSPIPLISIVQSACDAAKIMGLKRVGLFGSRFTMRAGFYPDTFSKAGITVIVPDAEEQDYIHTKYMSELINGVFNDATREGLLDIAGRMKEDQRIDGLVLGGTELPLILRDGSGRGIPFLDTGKIHVEAAVAKMLSA